LGVLGALFGVKPTIDPVAMRLITNRRLFLKPCYQTMPGGTLAFSMLSSDYNVLRSMIIALNNFIR